MGDWRDDTIEMLKDSLREALQKLADAEERAERAEEALSNLRAEVEDHLAGVR